MEIAPLRSMDQQQAAQPSEEALTKVKSSVDAMFEIDERIATLKARARSERDELKALVAARDEKHHAIMRFMMVHGVDELNSRGCKLRCKMQITRPKKNDFDTMSTMSSAIL
jgi:uncharacterized small protein (DUF1192 family)